MAFVPRPRLTLMDSAPRLTSRSLPSSPFLPGRTARPVEDRREIPFVPPERFRENEEFLFGIDLFNHGFYWEAHEAWEGVWRRCARGTVQHVFLQGLIQITASYLKRVLDEARAADDLLDRGCRRLENLAVERVPFHGVRVQEFAAACRKSPATAPLLSLAD